MEQILEYLRQLSANNNREWFNANKKLYVEAKARFDGVVDQIIAGIREFDPSIGPLTAKDATYRIYRDTRFSQDKTPYKTHMGAFIVPGGKKSGYSGYYFHLSPHDDGGYPGTSMLATGNYWCDPRVVRTLREDMTLDDGEAFAQALAEAKCWTLDYEGALKRIPAGYAADKPYSDWLRLRNYCLVKQVDTDYMTTPGLVERVVDDFRCTKPFLDLVNRTIGYVADGNAD